jgi:hypothetical protein
MIDVSGARKSCVTESSKTERKRSPSRVASACASFLHCSGALGGEQKLEDADGCPANESNRDRILSM